MIRRAALAAAVAAVAALCLAAPARAQTPPDPAAALHTQIVAWLAEIARPGVLPEPEIVVANDGRLHGTLLFNAVPLPDGRQFDAGPVTLEAEALPGGAWRFHHIVSASPSSVTSGKPGPRQLKAEHTFDSAVTSGTVDPTFATSTRIETRVSGLRTALVGQVPGAGSTSAIRALSALVTIDPAGPAGLTMLSTFNTQAVRVSFPRQDGPRQDVRRPQQIGHFAAGSISADARALGIRPASASPLLKFGRLLFPTVALAAPSTVPDAIHARSGQQPNLSTFKDLAATLRDGFASLDGTMEVRALETSTDEQVQATIAHLVARVAVKRAGSLSDLRFGLDLDGLAVPDLSDPLLRDLVPRRGTIEIAARALPLAALTDAVVADAATGRSGSAAYTNILAGQPLDITIEKLAFNLGPAEMSGHARVTGRAPGAVEFTAELRATRFADLLKQVRGAPHAGPALAAMVFLNGLAERDGPDSVWRIQAGAGHARINGADISKMLPLGTK